MDVTTRITDFLVEIGIQIHFETIHEPTFLPGIFIRQGELVIDKDKLLYPGDIVHEAGHLAVMPPRIRKDMTGDIGSDDKHIAGEIAAIAWSYAVCLHLGIDPYIVFHEHGYKGGGAHLVESFEQGSEMGVPLLVWQEMTESVRSNSTAFSFPKMRNWTCVVDRYQT